MEALNTIAGKVSCTAKTLKKWVKQQGIDQGELDSLNTSIRERLKQLERKKRELKQVNQNLRKASAFFRPGGARPPTQEMIAFIDAERDCHGVEPICKHLPLAESTYYEHKTRESDPDKEPNKSIRNRHQKVEIQCAGDDNMRIYGARKIWKQLKRESSIIARCTVERSMDHLEAQLGDYNGTLLTDSYGASEQYQKKTPELTHAQCRVHTRRYFYRSAESEPEAKAAALTYIARLYTIEKQIKNQQLKGENKRHFREMHSKPVVDAFYNWCHEQRQRIDLVNSNPLSKALNYVIKRCPELKNYLGDPEVPMDNNHLERALRVIPMGRKNWLFCWTEIGAEHVGIIQSLLVTCKLHKVNFYDYLVDVLQRISSHPAAKVKQLTPRLWKELFADNPMRSDLMEKH